MPKCGIASRRSWLRILRCTSSTCGYGRSGGFGAMSLEEMAQRVLENAPERAMWLGWSLGGLVASQVALSHPDRVQALVTVASSPALALTTAGPGLSPTC